MASTYLSRTPSTAGDQQIFTFSTWFKRGSSLGTEIALFTGSNDANQSGFFTIMLDSNDSFKIDYYESAFKNITTNRVLRDTSAFYHVVVAVDTTQATDSNRIKIYINGEQETSFSNSAYPTQNFNFDVNSTDIQQVGVRRNGTGGLTGYWDGIMAHTHLIDGTTYDASTFGETDSTTGIWKPKTAPSVTYGTNGFFLKFENSGAFGTDSSGNGNNWTVNGTMTQTIDTPSNVFATLNPLDPVGTTGYNPSLSEGNNTLTETTGAWMMGLSTLAVSSGKYYLESKITAQGNGGRVGIYSVDDWNTQASGFPFAGQTANSWVYRTNQGYVDNNASSTTGLATSGVGDIVSMAVDLDNNYIYFGKNGTWLNSGDPESGATGTGGFALTANTDYFMFIGVFDATLKTNFGNGYFGTTAVASAQNPDDGIGIFEYSVPTGYKALCTKSINAQEYS